VSEVLEDFAFIVRNPSGGVNAGVLGFGDERADDGNAGRVGRDGVIEEGVWVEGQVGRREAEEVERCCHDPGLGAGEVGGVGEHLQDHVGSAVQLPTVRMRGHETKETIEASHGGESGGGLFTCEGAGGRKDASVDTPAVI
jgi:hypothetical protein